MPLACYPWFLPGLSAKPALSGVRLAAPLQAKRSARTATQTVRAAAEAPAANKNYGVFKLSYSIDNEPESRTQNWKKTINVAVSGAAGQISNHLLFMLASGSVFGNDQPIALKLLGSERSYEALEGVAMELEDSLYPLLREVRCPPDPLTHPRPVLRRLLLAYQTAALDPLYLLR